MKNASESRGKRCRRIPRACGVNGEGWAGYHPPSTIIEDETRTFPMEAVCSVANLVEVEQKPAAPEWLARTWRHHGKTTQFDLDMQQWLEEYPDLSKLIEASNGSLLDAWPVPDGKTPAVYTIQLKPRTSELLQASREKPGPKTHTRQVTVEGKEFDIRNGVNFALVHARIQDVENVAHSYLHQFRSEPTKRQRRRLLLELHRVMLLRGKELSRPLYDSISLRLGMPLPEDFWCLPPEMLPNVGKTCSSPPFPLANPEKSDRVEVGM
jgi:hypothetical protein